MFRNLESPSLAAPSQPGSESKRNVTGLPRLRQLGPDQSRKQFPRPPSSQGQQACPDLGQALAALGFVSSCLETSRGHLILPLALSKKRPSRQGSAACPASSGLLSPVPEAVLPPVLSRLSRSHFQARPSCSEPSFPGNLISPRACPLTLLLSHIPVALEGEPREQSPETRGEARPWAQTGLCAESDSISNQTSDLVSHVTLLPLVGELNEITREALSRVPGTGST